MFSISDVAVAAIKEILMTPLFMHTTCREAFANEDKLITLKFMADSRRSRW
jgi:hypothetical protein